MAVAAGTKLGPYEIVAAIGAGAMGEVYRARDTNLHRDVALKILPQAFALDADRLARFRREAQLLASLNHPHVAAIYGFEDGDGLHALVLELVEGPTLADRIAQGPVPLDDALAIATQMAEGVEAAHEKGVVHRDLKPANIKLTPDGQVKILDFGLAKLSDSRDPSPAPEIALTASPTITSPAMTGLGVILGTAAYMSPEQVRGKAVDKRADIWAFGVVLWEMLTGTRLFAGETLPQALADVLGADISLQPLPRDTPPAIRRLIRRCLDRDVRCRLRDIGEARIAIDHAITSPADGTESDSTADVASPGGWRRATPWGVGTALTLVLGIMLALWRPWTTPPSLKPLRVMADVGADVSLALPGPPGANLALSADGQVMGFVAAMPDGRNSQLFVRHLDQLKALPVPGTDGGDNPFFSPDGRWVAFFAGGSLKKVPVNGGAVIELSPAPNDRGGTWGDDDTIVFTPNSGPGTSLQKVSSAGGTAATLLPLVEGEVTQRWPQMLPGSRAVLFTSSASTGNGYENANIVVQRLPNGERKILQRGGYFAHYVGSGHLLYVHSGTVFAVPFDVTRLELTGVPVPILEGVNVSSATGAAQLAVSNADTLVYFSGQAQDMSSPIVWMGADGKPTPLRATAANWGDPAFSPDGTRLAFDLTTGGQLDMWVHDWQRETSTRMTFGPGDSAKPIWTPDNLRIAFSSTRDRTNGTNGSNLYWMRADLTGDVQRLTEGDGEKLPTSWHPSGKFLAYQQQNRSGGDIMILPMQGNETSGWTPGQPYAFVETPFNEQEPVFSPDGRWLAYMSSESGQFEIYVRPFPGPGGKVQVSRGGGVFPAWSLARKELFFGDGADQIMVASYAATNDVFTADRPRLWSPGRYLERPRNRHFALHPDGKRFALAAAPTNASTTTQNRVVFFFNVVDELRRIAPEKK